MIFTKHFVMFTNQFLQCVMVRPINARVFYHTGAGTPALHIHSVSGERSYDKILVH